MAEFQEFLDAKEAKRAQESQEKDFEVEIWNKDGAGVRTKRSHAKPFLQQLGLDLDPEPPANNDPESETDPKANRTATGKQSSSQASGGVARKYFTKPTTGTK